MLIAVSIKTNLPSVVWNWYTVRPKVWIWGFAIKTKSLNVKCALVQHEYVSFDTMTWILKCSKVFWRFCSWSRSCCCYRGRCRFWNRGWGWYCKQRNYSDFYYTTKASFVILHILSQVSSQYIIHITFTCGCFCNWMNWMSLTWVSRLWLMVWLIRLVYIMRLILVRLLVMARLLNYMVTICPHVIWLLVRMY